MGSVKGVEIKRKLAQTVNKLVTIWREHVYARIMTTSINSQFPHFERRLKELSCRSVEGPMELIAAQYYGDAVGIFTYISSRIDHALANGLYINESFAFGTLHQVGDIVHKLDSYLFDPQPAQLTADLECLFMVTGKSRRGRPATARRRHLQLADRHARNESWGDLTLHTPSCDRKGGCDCRETTRRDPRRVTKYLEHLVSHWDDFWDLAWVEERLFS